MRQGMNPMNHYRMQGYPEKVACVVTHLPNLEGYHAQRLEIVKLCLTSLRENAGEEMLVYVWDNGSCGELRQWLAQEYMPNFITFSPNIGKSAARYAMVRAFPAETVVCVSDDDIYFQPGWLAPQMELLTGFPNVGAVSGYPVRTQFRWGTSSTVAWAEKFARVERGRFISEQYERDFCVSIGRDYEEHARNTIEELDTAVVYNGMTAYATAHHCQWIGYAGRVAPLVEWSLPYLADDRELDKAIDRAGYLRLCTPERLVRHMGNIIDDELRQEIEKWQTVPKP